MPLTTRTILGIFSDRAQADDSLARLSGQGYDVKDVSVIVRDMEVTEQMANVGESNIVSGAVSGATAGGALGGIAGLLIGIGAIAIPGIGGLLIGGPLAAALGLTGAAATTVSGAATGALAGGIVGALVGIGVPEETAVEYEQRLKEGAILLAVPTSSVLDEDQVRAILEESGADQIRTVG